MSGGPATGAAHEALAETAVTDAVRARLAEYAAFLLEWNERINLTSARNPAAVVEHIRDSLTLLPFVLGEFIDVGSGGGFPAIPLAIAVGMPVTLVESVAKKAAFLRAAVERFGLRADVVDRRAEDAGRDAALRERFTYVTARAVGPIATVLELTVPFLAVAGLGVLQRGRIDEVERERVHDASLVLGARIEAEIELAGETERRIVLVRKIASTGPRFPRRSGVPAKRPLCSDGN